jgi:hypothetical protein
MSLWVVYRHGWDDANQSPSCGLPEKMAVARIEAGSADEACRLAVRQVTLTGHQRLSAEPAGVADSEEHDLNRKVEAL